MKRSIAILAMLALMFTGFSTTLEADTGVKAKLRAKLRGDRTSEVRGQAGSGYASNGEGRQRMWFRMRSNLPAGTVVDVTACGAAVGTITLQAGKGVRSVGFLKLSTGAGDVLPDCVKGDPVMVAGSGLSIEGKYRGRSES